MGEWCKEKIGNSNILGLGGSLDQGEHPSTVPSLGALWRGRWPGSGHPCGQLPGPGRPVLSVWQPHGRQHLFFFFARPLVQSTTTSIPPPEILLSGRKLSHAALLISALGPPPSYPTICTTNDRVYSHAPATAAIHHHEPHSQSIHPSGNRGHKSITAWEGRTTLRDLKKTLQNGAQPGHCKTVSKRDIF